MKNYLKACAVILSFFLASNTMAGVNPNVQAFLNKINSAGGKPMEQMSPQDARNVLVSTQNSVPVDLSQVTTQQKMITVDGQPVMLTIVRPINAKNNLPVFMFFHGGGWVIGDYPTHQRLIRDLVVNSGAVAVYVDYTRSPEAHYPVAINQAYGATKWVAEHGNEINVDGSRLAVVGNSVGGNMATVVAMMAKNKNTPAIKLQVLFWPVTNDNFNTSSYNKFAQGYFLTRNMMKWFWDNYIPNQKQRQDIYASPLKATTTQLQGLPPALIIVAGNDVLRDEILAYAHKLKSAGVNVKLVRYDDTIHDFMMLNPLANDSDTKSAILLSGEELKKYLQVSLGDQHE